MDDNELFNMDAWVLPSNRIRVSMSVTLIIPIMLGTNLVAHNKNDHTPFQTYFYH
jgi:hypothetical protein